jgi:3-oxoadipate enol-lactonase
MSQGGFLSLRAALTAPDRVRALILLDTQAGIEDPEVVPGYEGLRDTWLAAGPVDELVEAVAALIISDPEVNPSGSRSGSSSRTTSSSSRSPR